MTTPDFKYRFFIHHVTFFFNTLRYDHSRYELDSAARYYDRAHSVALRLTVPAPDIADRLAEDMITVLDGLRITPRWLRYDQLLLDEIVAYLDNMLPGWYELITAERQAYNDARNEADAEAYERLLDSYERYCERHG